MKNIHLIPTDKPSRLSILNSGKLNFGAEFISSSNSKAQNIYITNSEEIKEKDWFLGAINLVYKFTSDDVKNGFKPKGKKIILTTDQDLIKDGVQAIDDEFLEWFVKNPSCEEVEVKEKQHFEADKSKRENPLNGVYYSYKIIIPKEDN